MTPQDIAPDDDSLRALIEQARDGHPEALGRMLEHQRNFLRRLARQTVGGRLRTRFDDSDLVQQTFASAVRNFGQFQGSEPREFLAWLKLIHERNIQDAIRDNVRTEKRAIGNEERFGDRPDPQTATASGQAMRKEGLAHLFALLDRLPEDQQTAVRLRHLEGWTLPQIAERLGRTEVAIAGLIKRGLQKLRAEADLREGRSR